MTDTDRGDPHPDSLPEANPHPDSEPLPPPDDGRSDIEQAVNARSDAVARGEGGEEPSPLTDTGVADGSSGTGGVTKNQDETAQ